MAAAADLAIELAALEKTAGLNLSDAEMAWIRERIDHLRHEIAEAKYREGQTPVASEIATIGGVATPPSAPYEPARRTGSHEMASSTDSFLERQKIQELARRESEIQRQIDQVKRGVTYRPHKPVFGKYSFPDLVHRVAHAALEKGRQNRELAYLNKLAKENAKAQEAAKAAYAEKTGQSLSGSASPSSDPRPAPAAKQKSIHEVNGTPANVVPRMTVGYVGTQTKPTEVEYRKLGEQEVAYRDTPAQVVCHKTDPATIKAAMELAKDKWPGQKLGSHGFDKSQRAEIAKIANELGVKFRSPSMEARRLIDKAQSKLAGVREAFGKVADKAREAVGKVDQKIDNFIKNEMFVPYEIDGAGTKTRIRTPANTEPAKSPAAIEKAAEAPKAQSVEELTGLAAATKSPDQPEPAKPGQQVEGKFIKQSKKDGQFVAQIQQRDGKVLEVPALLGVDTGKNVKFTHDPTKREHGREILDHCHDKEKSRGPDL